MVKQTLRYIGCIVGILCVVAWTSCAPEIPELEYEDGGRIQIRAITLETPELVPGSTTTATALVHGIDPAQAEFRWELCLFIGGTYQSFQCAKHREQDFRANVSAGDGPEFVLNHTWDDATLAKFCELVTDFDVPTATFPQECKLGMPMVLRLIVSDRGDRAIGFRPVLFRNSMAGRVTQVNTNPDFGQITVMPRDDDGDAVPLVLTEGEARQLPWPTGPNPRLVFDLRVPSFHWEYLRFSDIEREDLTARWYPSAGTIDRKYYLREDETRDIQGELEFDGSPSCGQRVDMDILLRDGRGGFAVTERSVVLIPEGCELERDFPCIDGLDSDNDDLVDCEDLDCQDEPHCVEFQCNNGLDDQGDGRIDCEDPDCDDHPACNGLAENPCDDGQDSDGDELVDCDDPDCVLHLACSEVLCDDLIDNDNDGMTDCADLDCWVEGLDVCGAEERRSCEDEFDNDGNGLVDCADWQCIGWGRCSVSGDFEDDCQDRFDNDGDGATDCDDPDCGTKRACVDEYCGDGVVTNRQFVDTFIAPAIFNGFYKANICDIGSTCSNCSLANNGWASEHGMCQSLGYDYASYVAYGGFIDDAYPLVGYASNWTCTSREQCVQDPYLVAQCDRVPPSDTEFVQGRMLSQLTCVDLAYEECDDGEDNEDAPDACRSDCSLPRCGDGIVDSGESCDDANLDNEDGCTTVCQAPHCGDGILGEGEQCDDRNTIDEDSCRNGCLFNVCGDGVTNLTGTSSWLSGNQFVDGAGHSGYICWEDAPQCWTNTNTDEPWDGDDGGFGRECGLLTAEHADSPAHAVCREFGYERARSVYLTSANSFDGIIDSGDSEPGESRFSHMEYWDCLDGSCTFDDTSDGTSCDSRVVESILCENSYQACDDGPDNRDESDACRSDCTLPYCGDAIVDVLAGEECDDGNADDLDGCTRLCRLPGCGDGVVDPGRGEECDDGNNEGGDGCSPECVRDGECLVPVVGYNTALSTDLMIGIVEAGVTPLVLDGVAPSVWFGNASQATRFHTTVVMKQGNNWYTQDYEAMVQYLDAGGVIVIVDPRMYNGIVDPLRFNTLSGFRGTESTDVLFGVNFALRVASDHSLFDYSDALPDELVAGSYRDTLELWPEPDTNTIVIEAVYDRGVGGLPHPDADVVPYLTVNNTLGELGGEVWMLNAAINTTAFNEGPQRELLIALLHHGCGLTP